MTRGTRVAALLSALVLGGLLWVAGDGWAQAIGGALVATAALGIGWWSAGRG